MTKKALRPPKPRRHLSGMTAATVAIASIKIGKRHRRDLGDIAALAASMAKRGLIHPVAVTRDRRLVAGARRLAAAKQLGWKTIPVTIVEIVDDIVHGERDENVIRKDFTLSEAVAVADTLEASERAAAKQRQGRAGSARSEKFSGHTGNTLDKIAKTVGLSRPTLAKARLVVNMAKAEPERFGKLLAAMDKTGRVNAPHRRMKVAMQAEIIRLEAPPLPGHGPYRVIVVDPPWPYEIASEESSIRGVWPYPTLSVAQIAATDIESLAHKDAILWLWTTNYHMQVCFDLITGWGFSHRTILTWAKDHMGAGDWLRGQTEHAIMAIRGKPIVQLKSQSTLLHAPVRKHSQKPKEFYDFVERLCPAPRYCDLFSRYQHNAKWDCHGDQAPIVNTNEKPQPMERPGLSIFNGGQRPAAG